MPTELRIPNHVAADPDAREVLRVWISEGDLTFALKPDAWDDPAAWGLLLVDLARHVAQGIAAARGGEAETILPRIKAGFDAEWSAPTE